MSKKRGWSSCELKANGVAHGVTRYTAGRGVEIIEVNFSTWTQVERQVSVKSTQNSSKKKKFRLGFEKANVNLKEVFGRTNVEN